MFLYRSVHQWQSGDFLELASQIPNDSDVLFCILSIDWVVKIIFNLASFRVKTPILENVCFEFLYYIER